MKLEECKRAIHKKLKIRYKNNIYVADSIICSLINREWAYSVELIENYFDETKADCIIRARIEECEVVE